MDQEPESAGALLRRTRVRAQLSQAELALRAGVTQSVISAYESGHRQPALPTLAALIEAADHEMVIDIRPKAGALSKMTGPVGQLVRRKRLDLIAAAAAHGVKNLRVFGSVARGAERPDSDLDLLADLPPRMGLFGLGRVQTDLEAIVGRRVDLVPADDLKRAVRARVSGELVTL